MKVLLWGFGTRGDVQPMLALALALRAAGHSAELVGPPDYAAWIERSGFRYTRVGTSFEAFMRKAKHSGLALSRQSLDEIALQFDLPATLAEDADLVVGGLGAMAAPSYAERCRKPFRLLLPAAAYLPSRLWPAQAFAPLALPPWLNGMTWTLAGAGLDATFGRGLAVARAKLGLPPVTSAWRSALSATVWLAADPVLGPAEEIDSASVPAVEQLGAFLMSARDARLPDDLERFLETPAIAISFGSMPAIDADRLVRVLADATARAGRRAVIVAGGAAFSPGSVGEHVKIVSEIPFDALFGRVTAVVHHGGAGTLTLATLAGKPQVVVPHIFDNYYWARRLSSLGVAPPALPIHRLTAARLAARLAALTPEMHQRAEVLAPQVLRDGLSRAVAAVERAAASSV